MLMAQITDIHLGFDPDNPAEFNRKRLDQADPADLRNDAAARSVAGHRRSGRSG